jgi:hypothetical protein
VASGIAVAALAGIAVPAALGASASATAAAPKITKCTPATGAAVGKPLTIDGTALSGASKLTIAGKQAKIKTDSASKVTTVVTKTTTGGSVKIKVTTAGGTATQKCTAKAKKTKK